MQNVFLILFTIEIKWLKSITELGGESRKHFDNSLFSLNKPLFWRRLDNVVQLEPRRGQLLRGRLVLALRFASSAGHDQEHQDADYGNEKHPANHGANNQSNITSAGSLQFS